MIDEPLLSNLTTDELVQNISHRANLPPYVRVLLKRVAEQEEKVVELESHSDELEEKVAELEEKVAELESHSDKLEEKVDKLEEKVDELENLLIELQEQNNGS